MVRVTPEALEVEDAVAARDPVLAQLAAAAVAGLPPAGPVERKREPLTFATDGGLEIVGDLVVQDCGFNLHAKTHAGALDEDARTRLLRYVLRPPLSQERLTLLPNHRVRLTLKRPWSDGTYALEMDALALLARLAGKSRRPAASECPSPARVHQADQATAFWQPVSVHQVGRSSTTDVRSPYQLQLTPRI